MSQQGIGMTSQRTRERLIQRLMDQGITRFEVLEAIRSVPRHLFVDEALRIGPTRIRRCRLATARRSRTLCCCQDE